MLQSLTDQTTKLVETIKGGAHQVSSLATDICQSAHQLCTLQNWYFRDHQHYQNHSGEPAFLGSFALIGFLRLETILLGRIGGGKRNGVQPKRARISWPVHRFARVVLSLR